MVAVSVNFLGDIDSKYSRGCKVRMKNAFQTINLIVQHVNILAFVNSIVIQLGLILKAPHLSSIKISRFPTWFAGVITECSSICSTSLAALL